MSVIIIVDILGLKTYLPIIDARKKYTMFVQGNNEKLPIIM